MVDIRDETPREAASDEADLERFGYKQELRRTLGVFSSFAVAFSYISPSTGIFTLFFLGLTTRHGRLRVRPGPLPQPPGRRREDRKSTRLNSSHVRISYAVFCLKKKKKSHSQFFIEIQKKKK